MVSTIYFYFYYLRQGGGLGEWGEKAAREGEGEAAFVLGIGRGLGPRGQRTAKVCTRCSLTLHTWHGETGHAPTHPPPPPLL